MYALAYTLLNLRTLDLHKFRPGQINFSSTKSLLSTVMQLCYGWFDQPTSFSLVSVSVSQRIGGLLRKFTGG